MLLQISVVAYEATFLFVDEFFLSSSAIFFFANTHSDCWPNQLLADLSGFLADWHACGSPVTCRESLDIARKHQDIAHKHQEDYFSVKPAFCTFYT